MKKYALPGAVMLTIIVVIGGVIACPQTRESNKDEQTAAAAAVEGLIYAAPHCWMRRGPIADADFDNLIYPAPHQKDSGYGAWRS